MSAPIQRDYLTEFVAFLAKTPGRDKLCRTIQYASKFLKWVEESKLADAKKPSANVIMYGNVYSSMSMTRKSLRFFRTIGVVQGLLKMNPSASNADFCKFIANIALAGYFAFDNVMWAKKVGLVDLTAENTLLFDRLTEGCWLIEIVFGLPSAYAKYHEGASLERQLSKQVPTPKLELRKARSLKNAGLLELVQLFSDLPIALHFLNMTGDTPHGIFGLLGVVSSLIGCWQVWPTPA